MTSSQFRLRTAPSAVESRECEAAEGRAARLACVALLALLASSLATSLAPSAALGQSLIDEMEMRTRGGAGGGTGVGGAGEPAGASTNPAGGPNSTLPPRGPTRGPSRGPGVAVPGVAFPGQQLPGANPQGSGGATPGALVSAGSVDLGQVHRAWDSPVSAPGQVAPGLKMVVYDRSAPIEVRTRQFMPSLIHFPECEIIDPRDVILGDGEGFAAVPLRANVLAIYTKYEGVDTSLEAIGQSGNIYTFYVRGERLDSEDVTDLSIRIGLPGNPRAGSSAAPDFCAGGFAGAGATRAGGTGAGFAGNIPPAHAGDSPLSLPAAREGASRAVTAPDYLREVKFDLDRLDFNSHRMFAARPEDAVIAPERIFSDGRFVYLDYGSRAAQTRWPVVTMLVDGIDEPVNTRVIGERGQILLVMAMGDITLKSGQAVVCIRQRRDADLPDRLVIDKKLGLKPSRAGAQDGAQDGDQVGAEVGESQAPDPERPDMSGAGFAGAGS